MVVLRRVVGDVAMRVDLVQDEKLDGGKRGLHLLQLMHWKGSGIEFE